MGSFYVLDQLTCVTIHGSTPSSKLRGVPVQPPGLTLLLEMLLCVSDKSVALPRQAQRKNAGESVNYISSARATDAWPPCQHDGSVTEFSMTLFNAGATPEGTGLRQRLSVVTSSVQLPERSTSVLLLRLRRH
jgi:hypothetical protein